MGVSSALKWHGGKAHLAKRIVGLMPKHLHYVETHAGGLSVLLEKDPQGVSEVANDLNGDLSRFWFVLQDRDLFAEFQRSVEAIPFSETEFIGADLGDAVPNPRANWAIVERAISFFIRCRQSRAGQFKDFATLSRTRTRRGMNEQASAWLTAIEGLPAVHARLKRVAILNRDALDVIKQQDGKGTLFYLDPPYLHETRTSKDVYAHEMTDDQHRDLLTALMDVKGKFLLSGYRSKLYDDFADQWDLNRVDFEIANHAAGGKTKRRMTECVWMNYEPT